MRRILPFIIGLFGIVSPLFASELPFTDVKNTDPYYSAVQSLFTYGIIRDDGSHLFRPGDKVDRDAFVGLSVSVSCHQCLTPSIEDLTRYQTSPFTDISQSNPYFYCISYAADKGITQGYTLDTLGKFTCDNGTSFQSSPFCAKNQTSRIEATAMLLRQAGLWNDTLNAGSYTKSLNISDVTSYWYGYAQKGVQAGILSLKGDKVYPDESITRGEYAIMASKILGYNQCPDPQESLSVGSDILIKNPDGTLRGSSSIPLGESASLIGISEIYSGSDLTDSNWRKSWTLTHMTSGKQLTGSGDTYPLTGLECGKWAVTWSISDTGTRTIISQSSTIISLECTNSTAGQSLSVDISATPLTTSLKKPIAFSTFLNGVTNTGALIITWDFGDGTTQSGGLSPSHSYTFPGYFPVTLTVINPSTSETAQSSLVVGISDTVDSDGDGILDNDDLCPLVVGTRENSGCPEIETNNSSDIIHNLLAGNTDTRSSDTDGDGVDDSSDLCPRIVGSSENNGCPGVSLLENIQRNACLEKLESTQGLIFGQGVCDQCPCLNTLKFSAEIRQCDILFPTILSPDRSLIYSRGGLYQVP